MNKIIDKFPLGRVVSHDNRSLGFAFDTSGLSIVNITHKRHIDILNQGQIGSCTGNAGIGDIATTPLFEKLPIPLKYSLDESGALKLYEDAQVIDGVLPYPANDFGSSGLSIAKVLKNAGIISGYQHTFTLQDALKAGSQYPFITGINWYSGMYYPDADGRVHITGSIVGGHEIQMYRIDADNGRIWFHNSWGNTWGVNGDFYLTWADYATLLSQYGDTTLLFPDIVPTPVPKPIVPTVILTRNSDDGVQTLGSLDVGFKTLERPWKNNTKNISCIPKGTYLCKYNFSLGKLGWGYEVQGVPNRSGIRIHVGNYWFNSDGCILLGNGYSDINKDGEIDVINSKISINAFVKLMGKKDFYLTIK
jgi:hypothetical protein